MGHDGCSPWACRAVVYPSTFNIFTHPGMFTMLGSKSLSVVCLSPAICRCPIVVWVALLVCGVGASLVSAQAVAPDRAPASAQARDATLVKQFAPGVLTTIPPDVQEGEIDAVHDLVEIRTNKQLERDSSTISKSRTLFEMARNAHFRAPTWCLEFTFKPLRMLEVDVPQISGKMQRKLIWYMVYRVRNTGVGLAPREQADGTFVAVSYSPKQVRFIPQLVLVSLDQDRHGKRVRKAYLDRILPAALGPIERREFPGGRLLNSAQLAERLLMLEAGRTEQGIWGVATWEDVDPQIDYFSVFVGGLSRALQWHDSPGAFQPGDLPGKGRKFLSKTLQLNFWRPGDALAENEREIRYGIPPGQADLYNCDEGVAYRWIYR